MISTIEHKKYVASAGIFGIIISELYYKKKPCLIILLKVNKCSKITFYHIILLLSLAVCLQVKDSEESLFNTKERA